MKIAHSNIHAKSIQLLDNGLVGENFQINPKYFKSIIKLDTETYKVNLSVKILNTDENPFPINLVVEFETTFTITEYKSQEEVDTFLNITAIQMIFPFMRSAINSVVTSALFSPLVLPLIDVRQFQDV